MDDRMSEGEYQEMRDVIDELSPIWTMRDGRTIAVVDMEDSHVMNALAMVKRQEQGLQLILGVCEDYMREAEESNDRLGYMIAADSADPIRKQLTHKRYWIRIFTLELERRAR